MHHSRGRIRGTALLAIAAAAAALGLTSACGTASTPAPPTEKPCGVSTTAPATYQHVIWILMENKSLGQVIGSSEAPYINKLAGQCGLATNYQAITHPSLPNYVALTSGGLQGVADDADPSAHPLTVPSIFSQLGGDWRGLEESMKTNCEQKNDGNYAVRHNPAAYYTTIRDNCADKDIPLPASGSLTGDLSAKFTFVTPNVCDDMHSVCSTSVNGSELQTGDKFLSTLVPKLINSNEYQTGKTAIFLTFDEGGSGPNKVVTEVIAPTVTPGTTSGILFSHYSLLGTTEEMLGLPKLGEAAHAASMKSAFGL